MKLKNYILALLFKQMSESPQLFVDGISRFDVIQGEAGDCYFLASCSALSMQPKLLEKVTVGVSKQLYNLFFTETLLMAHD